MAFIPGTARVMETSTTSGNGPYALAGAVDASYSRFSVPMAVGDTTLVSVVEPGVAFWTGIGTYSAVNEITLTTVEESKGTFGAGTKQIFMGPLAGRQLALDGAQTISSAKRTQGATNLRVPSAAGAQSLTSAEKFQALNNLGKDLHGADIASAATLNLDNATGDLVDVTGTTGITAITLAEGHRVVTRFTGIVAITAGASLVPPGNATYTTAAGDFIEWGGYAGGLVRAIGFRPAALPAIALSGSASDLVAGTVPTARLGSGTANSSSWYRGDQVFTSALPGTLVSLVEYSSTQTITIPAGATRAIVKLWGGSGGAVATTVSTPSAGAGAGALVKYLTGLTPGNTLSLTLGAAGAAGNNANAGAGGNSTLASGTQSITTLTANGGGGGVAANPTVPASGGTATNGDRNITGQRASPPGWDGASYIVAVGGHTGLGFSLGGDGKTGTNTGANPGTIGGCTIEWYM